MTSRENHNMPAMLPDSQPPLMLPEASAGNPAQFELRPSRAAESAEVVERPPRRLVRAAKAVGGLGLTAYLLLGGGGGEQEAHADASHIAAKPAATAEPAPSQSSELSWDPSTWNLGTNIPIGLSVVTAGAGVVALRKQTKEKIEARLVTAERDLAEIDDKTTGEQRGARLLALEPFSKKRKYRLRVFETANEYLMGRRSGIENLKKEHLGPIDPENPPSQSATYALEQAITERRYADRRALKLFLKTLPAARKAAKMAKGRGLLRRNQDEFADLAAHTNAEQDSSTYEVSARGLNLDNMRGITRANLSAMDLTGAGLKYDDFKLVNFSGSSLRETHLRGSVIANSDLRGTDLRAAYFQGAVIKDCLIDENTQMGELPENHTNATFGGLNHAERDAKRGNGEVVLSNLISKDGKLTKEQIIERVKEWQQNGITLLAGSDHEYFLNPADDPNWVNPLSTSE